MNKFDKKWKIIYNIHDNKVAFASDYLGHIRRYLCALGLGRM